MLEISVEYEILPEAPDTFLLGKLGSCEPLDKPGWSVMVCRVAGRRPASR